MFNFFKKKSNIKGRSKEDLIEEKNIETIEEKRNEESDGSPFALYLLFPESFILNKELIIQRINSINNEEVKINPVMGLDGEDALYCDITIGTEMFKLAGIDIAMPKEICDYTIGCAYGDKEELEAMRQHNYHIIAYYEGKSTDQNIIYNLFAKLAYGFLVHDLVGMANGYSWNALTPSLIKGLFEDDRAKEMACTPAFMIWRNFIKMPYNNKVWFVTKGNSLYGVHEYAFYGDFEDSQEVYNMFEDIFNYAYSTKADIMAGHTIQIGEDVYLKFSEVYELEDDLQGEGIGTLVIEKITKSQINR